MSDIVARSLLVLSGVLSGLSAAQAEILTPLADPQTLIWITADEANRWQQGSYEVLHLRGRCQVKQGDVTARGREAVLWITRAEPGSGRLNKVICYLEGDATVDFARDGQPHATTGRNAQSIVGLTWFGRFHSLAGIHTRILSVGGGPEVKPPIFHRGWDLLRPEQSVGTQPAQFVEEEIIQPNGSNALSNLRSVTVEPRSNIGFRARSVPSPNQNEQVTIVDWGVKITIEGRLPVDGGAASVVGDIDRIVILCDRLVVWSPTIGQLRMNDPTLQRGESPLEFYMEGNIVFAQGERRIYADRMYYNVPGKFGIILNAEMLTDVPGYDGLLRLKADVLQQINDQSFMAYDAALTSSRLAVPRYWLQSGNVAVRHEQTPVTDPFTGQPVLDPVTGAPEVDHSLLATSRNNFTYVGGIPVFYWPVIASELTKPTYYLNRVRVGNDSVFGTQVMTNWDLYQLLGIRNPPSGTEWDVSFDYLSDRGLGIGTNFEYDREGHFGAGDRYSGYIDAWGINDQGLDVLGRDRRAVRPEVDLRGRVLGRHRHWLSQEWTLTGEVGNISDRNFLEQYYEREWDEFKDQTTGVELKRTWANQSFAAAADVRLNEFFTQTEQLPRLDHFMLGQSVLFDRLTWFAHSHAGYYRLKPGSRPSPINPVDAGKFNRLPWEVDVEGFRAGTRQEIDLPVQVGPTKYVLYVLGDATYWQEDIDRSDLLRLYGQAGLRSSFPIWRTDPAVQSALFNLNGLSHKIVLDSDFFYADASQNLDRLPLYDPLDDDAQEFFRQRIPDDTFFGAPFRQDFAPRRFDDRFYAFRNGMQGWITAPSAEIADDLIVSRTGLRQRWQTKRGMPGSERIIDWISFDVEGYFYSEPDRDNFGADLGLIDYDFRWYVGDRLALLSDGFFDFFGQGLRSASLGAVMSRPGVGDLYLGFRSIEGPITSSIVSASLKYRMSEKWLAVAGGAVDFGPTGNIGQNLSLVRIGESFLVRIGFAADVSRGNIGVRLEITPRFLPDNRLSRVGGVDIPPAGTFGLE